MKHTKGPWVYGEEYDGLTPIKSAMTNETVCKLIVVRGGQSELNAQLIAAAPDLMFSARTVLGYLEASDQSVKVLKETENIRAILREAIAKAEGK